MDTLIEKMNELLATTFAAYLKAHNFHWNVRGLNFSQYHAFFATIYELHYGAVDPTAEEIRALGAPAPGGLGIYKEKSRVTDTAGTLDVPQMISALYYDNQTIIDILNEVHDLAQSTKQHGLLNFIEGRLDEHKKYAWQLSASMGTNVASTTIKEEEQVEDVAEPIAEVEPITEEVRTYRLIPNK